MKLCFVNASSSPWLSSVDTTTDTLSTWDFDGKIDIAFSRIKDKLALARFGDFCRSIALDWVVARHFSKADTATHRGSPGIFVVSPGPRCSEKGFGFGWRKLVSFHIDVTPWLINKWEVVPWCFEVRCHLCYLHQVYSITKVSIGCQEIFLRRFLEFEGCIAFRNALSWICFSGLMGRYGLSCFGPQEAHFCKFWTVLFIRTEVQKFAGIVLEAIS